MRSKLLRGRLPHRSRLPMLSIVSKENRSLLRLGHDRRTKRRRSRWRTCEQRRRLQRGIFFVALGLFRQLAQTFRARPGRLQILPEPILIGIRERNGSSLAEILDALLARMIDRFAMLAVAFRDSHSYGRCAN